MFYNGLAVKGTLLVVRKVYIYHEWLEFIVVGVLSFRASIIRGL